MKTIQRSFILILCLLMMCSSVISVSAAQTEESTLTNEDTIPVVEINGCETAEGWTADGEISVDTEDMTQGDGCISVSLDAPKDGNSILSAQTTFDNVDITNFSMISFDFYISDPSLLYYSRIIALDFGSAKVSDSALITWYEAAFSGIETAGWYRICLPLQDATIRGFDSSTLNYFGLQFFQVNPPEDLNDVEIKIDNISAVVPEYKKLRVLDTCDNVEGWTDWGVTPQRDVVNKKQGTASLTFQVQLPEQTNLVSQKQCDTINATGATHIEMDVYVSDIETFKYCNYAIQFEITSSGTCDHQEYSWSLDKYVLKDGWNHIAMPISQASICVGTNPELSGNPDLSRINYMRFHTLGITKAKDNLWTFRVDNIYFSAPQISGEELKLGATPIVREPAVEDPGTDVPGTDVPGTDIPGTDVPDTNQPDSQQPEKNESDLRARTTALRAKILLLVMAFVIVAVDVVVVALRRRHAEQPVLQEESVAAGMPQPVADSEPAILPQNEEMSSKDSAPEEQKRES